MKRTILASIVGLAAMAAATVSYGQGHVFLDNYASTAQPLITYGAGGGGTTGAGVSGSQWTVGWYWALGSVTVSADPTGIADPSTLGPIALDKNDSGDTAPMVAPGQFSQPNTAIVEGYSSGVITVEVVCYNGTTYANSTDRGHSSAFTMTPATGSAATPYIGDSMPSFSTFATTPTPEPSIFALSGIGAAALMLFRRKK